MKSIDELIDSASELAERGLSRGEIADELNVSRETASWLVEQSGETPASTTEETASPVDVHVDWSAFGRDSNRLFHLGAAMADVLGTHAEEDVDLTIGIGKSGAPLATTVSRELDTDLSVYMPSKYYHDEDGSSGSFSRNFASIRGRDCFIVDDNIDTGQTMTETIETVREQGGNPIAAVVLTDKRGDDAIDDVPVYSMLEIVNVSE